MYSKGRVNSSTTENPRNVSHKYVFLLITNAKELLIFYLTSIYILCGLLDVEDIDKGREFFHTASTYKLKILNLFVFKINKAEKSAAF